MHCVCVRFKHCTEKCTVTRIVSSPKFHFICTVYIFARHKSNAGLVRKTHIILPTSFENALTVIEVLKDLKLNQILTITKVPHHSTKNIFFMMPLEHYNNVAGKTNLPMPRKKKHFASMEQAAIHVYTIRSEHLANKHHCTLASNSVAVLCTQQKKKRTRRRRKQIKYIWKCVFYLNFFLSPTWFICSHSTFGFFSLRRVCAPALSLIRNIHTVSLPLTRIVYCLLVWCGMLVIILTKLFAISVVLQFFQRRTPYTFYEYSQWTH